MEAPTIAGENILAITPPIIPAAGTAVEKKKPGRPKKKIATVPIEVHGIVDAPVNEEDLLELVYCNPNMFKKIFHLFKQFEVSEVEMNFDKQGLKIVTKDHIGKSTIYTTIDGRCMNLYYCAAPMRVCIKRDNLEKVLRTLSKNHYKITFLLRANYRSSMYVIIKDFEYDSDDAYDIDVVYSPEQQIVECKDNNEEYPIKFCISAKHFKTRINNIKNLSPTMAVEKSGNGPLQLTYVKSSNKQNVGWTSVYNDPAKIKLISTIADDDLFSVSVCIDYIKPFSNTVIGDEVFIAASKDKRMSFMTRLDQRSVGWSAEIIVFTDIKKFVDIKNVADGIGGDHNL